MKQIDNISDIYNIAYIHQNLMSVMIELTSLCNWNCEHCYVTDIEQDTYNMHNLKEIFIKLRDKGVNEIVFIGGEMFIRKDIMEIVSLARSMFFKVVLESNISLLNEKIIKSLKDLNISEISCTIFSLDPNVHDSITRKKGSLDKVLKNIELLYENNIFTVVKTPLMKKNKNSYIELNTYLKNKNIKHEISLNIFPKRDGSNTDNLSLTIKDIENIIKDIDNINTNSFDKKDINIFPCPNTKISLFLDNKGYAYPCVNYRESLGNIFIDDLEDIWNNPKRKQIANLRYKDLELCMSCEYFDKCIPCPGISHMETKSIYNCASSASKSAKARTLRNIK